MGGFIMEKLTTSKRLKQIMNERGLKQVEILELCKFYSGKYQVKVAKNDLSQYISGKVQPSQNKLTVLALALNVNEVWLLGYDVPPETDAFCNNLVSNYSEDEISIINSYRELNEDGQERMFTYVEDLVISGRYEKYIKY